MDSMFKFEVLYPRNFYSVEDPSLGKGAMDIGIENLRFRSKEQAVNYLKEHGLMYIESDPYGEMDYVEYTDVVELKDEIYIHGECDGVLLRILPLLYDEIIVVPSDE